MHKIWKYPQDMIQCVRLSHCIYICLLYTFTSKEIPFLKVIMWGTFDISCAIFSNVIISNIISLVLRDSVMDPENIVLYQMARKHALQKVFH